MGLKFTRLAHRGARVFAKYPIKVEVTYFIRHDIINCQKKKKTDDKLHCFARGEIISTS